MAEGELEFVTSSLRSPLSPSYSFPQAAPPGSGEPPSLLRGTHLEQEGDAFQTFRKAVIGQEDMFLYYCRLLSGHLTKAGWGTGDTGQFGHRNTLERPGVLLITRELIMLKNIFFSKEFISLL